MIRKQNKIINFRVQTERAYQYKITCKQGQKCIILRDKDKEFQFHISRDKQPTVGQSNRRQRHLLAVVIQVSEKVKSWQPGQPEIRQLEEIDKGANIQGGQFDLGDNIEQDVAFFRNSLEGVMSGALKDKATKN